MSLSCRQLSLLGLIFLSSNWALAQSAVCPQDPNDKSQQPKSIAINFGYDGLHGPGTDPANHKIGFDTLGSSSKDARTMASLQKNLIGSKALPAISDDFFNGMDPNQPVDDSPEDMAMQKKKFLEALKQSIGNGTGSKTVLFSGHGTPCLDPSGKQHWCMVLPMHPDMSGYQADAEGSPILNANEPFLVSDTDLEKYTGADNFILDSCHSDLAKAQFKQMTNGNGGITLLASSLGGGVSTDGNSGGRLLSELQKFTDEASREVASDPSQARRNFKICQLDLKGNGEISYREALLAMQLNVLRANNVKNITGLLQEALNHPERDTNQPVSASSPISDVFGGLVSDKCFVKIDPALCPKPYSQDPVPVNKCDAMHAENLAAVSKWKSVAQDPTSLNFLISRDDQEAINSGGAGLKENFTHQQVREAFGYVRKWVMDAATKERECLQRESPAVADFRMPGNDGQCHPSDFGSKTGQPSDILSLLTDYDRYKSTLNTGLLSPAPTPHPDSVLFQKSGN